MRRPPLHDGHGGAAAFPPPTVDPFSLRKLSTGALFRSFPPQDGEGDRRESAFPWCPSLCTTLGWHGYFPRPLSRCKGFSARARCDTINGLASQGGEEEFASGNSSLTWALRHGRQTVIKCMEHVQSLLANTRPDGD